jgi:LPXTG-site transpeptidase (sortase) family protein
VAALLRKVLIGVGGLIVILCVVGVGGWFGYDYYVRHMVADSPGTSPIIKTSKSEVPLGQYEGGNQVVKDARRASSGTDDTMNTASAADSEAASEQEASAGSTTNPGAAILPPTGIKIPRINVDVPVYLGDAENEIQAKAASWLMGTGFPGFRGNCVVFGSAAGEFAIFARLAELGAGDEVIIGAVDQTYRFVVTETRTVNADAVEELLPSEDYRLTLITGAGQRSIGGKGFSQRLIIVAKLIR